ncbi:MAG TPA: hypothetical protein VGH33_03745 [Isosphaeraceae bacterium]
MWVHKVGQYSLLIPATIMLVAGFLLALRSVDAGVGPARGVRQLAINLTYTVAMVALVVAVLLILQGIVGFNFRAFQ